MLELPVPISDLGSVYMRMEFHCNKLRVQQSGEGLLRDPGKGGLSIMAYTGRLRGGGTRYNGIVIRGDCGEGGREIFYFGL